ncbi:hypothetical protein [Thiocapsa bogorovii]|uniref:hypothetical protein n=1 Tax=Thiocapsa bogorovii TaxID=521689 RepID=UPI001E5CF4BE|nr:hypothetical protein [Thiocapsa bogorovii]UHD14483.1 hypothetical protein LT988_14350 [Thiocapsa bogorovii]
MISCIVSAGRGDAVIKAAQAMGATGALVYHARGIGARERLGLPGIAIEADKDVVSILVASDYQDAVFEAVYGAADEADALFDRVYRTSGDPSPGRRLDDDDAAHLRHPVRTPGGHR